VIEAQRLRVHSAKEVRFERVSFRSDFLVMRSWLTGDVVFSSTECGRNLDFGAALVGGSLRVEQTQIAGALTVAGIRLKGKLSGYAAVMDLCRDFARASAANFHCRTRSSTASWFWMKFISIEEPHSKGRG
jgi:hypothetical protein